MKEWMLSEHSGKLAVGTRGGIVRGDLRQNRLSRVGVLYLKDFYAIDSRDLTSRVEAYCPQIPTFWYRRSGTDVLVPMLWMSNVRLICSGELDMLSPRSSPSV